MWHFIFDKMPKNRDLLLAVLDNNTFHVLEFRAATAMMGTGLT